MTKNILSWIGVLATLATIGSGIYQYSHSKDQEFRKAFWEKQYQLYSEATDIAAKISVAKDLQNVEKERAEFWYLYYGKMSIVENKAVYDAMVTYGKKLESLEEAGRTSPELKQLAYNLSRACRESLKATWEPVPLDDIPTDRVWNLK
jgi:oligoendopeptidase F